MVEDDGAYLVLMQLLLSEEGGYCVSTCGPGEDGYKHVRQVVPHLDIVTGTPDAGWRTLQLLSHDPVTHSIPVLLCSAAREALERYRERTDRENVEVLPKPFDIDELLHKVGNLVGAETRGYRTLNE